MDCIKVTKSPSWPFGRSLRCCCTVRDFELITQRFLIMRKAGYSCDAPAAGEDRC